MFNFQLLFNTFQIFIHALVYIQVTIDMLKSGEINFVSIINEIFDIFNIAPKLTVNVAEQLAGIGTVLCQLFFIYFL